MDTQPHLIQTGPETYRLHLSTQPARSVVLTHHTRQGLGVPGLAPHTIATEVVRFLLEHDHVPEEGADLGAEAGRYPGFVEELRSRLG